MGGSVTCLQRKLSKRADMSLVLRRSARARKLMWFRVLSALCRDFHDRVELGSTRHRPECLYYSLSVEAEANTPAHPLPRLEHDPRSTALQSKCRSRSATSDPRLSSRPTSPSPFGRSRRSRNASGKPES